MKNTAGESSASIPIDVSGKNETYLINYKETDILLYINSVDLVEHEKSILYFFYLSLSNLIC